MLIGSLEPLTVGGNAGRWRPGDGVEDLVHAPDHVEQMPMALVQVAGRELVLEEHQLAAPRSPRC